MCCRKFPQPGQHSKHTYQVGQTITTYVKKARDQYLQPVGLDSHISTCVVPGPRLEILKPSQHTHCPSPPTHTQDRPSTLPCPYWVKASRLGFKSGHCYCCPTLACSLLYCGDGWILNTFKLLNGSPPHISGSFTCTWYFLLHNAHKLCSLELYSKCYSYGKLRYAPNNCHM